MYAVTILSLAACVVAQSIDEDIFAGNDPKDNYFRYVRTYAQENYQADGDGAVSGEDVPKPFGFHIYYPSNGLRVRRRRRRADETPPPSSSSGTTASTSPPSPPAPPAGSPNGDAAVDANDGDELARFDDELKPLELDVLDAPDNSSSESAVDADGGNHLVIDDFIRFKRGAGTQKAESAAALAPSGDKASDNVRPKRERQEQPGKSAKMLLADGELPDGGREPRGLVKDQWIKQPYQVQTSDPRSYEDAGGPINDIPAAPRVHFVTQRRSESAPPLVYHSYEREGRSRDLTRQRDMDLERDFDQGYYPRPPRHYHTGSGYENNYGGSGGHRRDGYYRPGEGDRDRQPNLRDPRDYDKNERYISRESNRPHYNYSPHEQQRYYDDERSLGAAVASSPKQKRIIYYATLPEIVRSPAAMDRERFNYRDDIPHHHLRGAGGGGGMGRDNRFASAEDRYASQPIAVGGGGGGVMNYRFRNERPPPSYGDDPGKPARGYDDATSGAKDGKVSSPDVNVRTLKKNPERRIYSEVDPYKRYPPPPYKTPGYQRDDGPYERNH